MDARLAKCLLISKVLVADGMMTDDERAFLATLMDHFQLSDADRQRVIDLEGWDEAEPIVKALPEAERRELVEMLVDAASADGHLSKQELGTVKQVAAALDIKI